MTIQDIVESCGYSTIVDMLKSNMTPDDYMDLLEEILVENLDSVNDIIDEIASDLGYVDEEQLKADKEDIDYQKFKDDRLG